MSERPTLPRLIGHRGAMAYAPENTLASMREAKARGAPWVEIDVKLSSDGVLVVMHDDNLKRTAGLDAPVGATPLNRIRALDAGGWFDPRFRGEPVPTFAELMGLLGDLGLGCNIEIKPNPGQEAETAVEVGKLVAEAWPRNLPAPLLSSFKDASLAAARDAAPKLPRALLFGVVPDDWKARAEAVGAVGVNVDGKRLTAPQAVAIKAAGYLLSAYTINDGAVARILAAMGCDCIITDRPDEIAAALG